MSKCQRGAETGAGTEGQGGSKHLGMMQGFDKGLNWQRGAAASRAAGMDWQEACREALGAVGAEGTGAEHPSLPQAASGALPVLGTAKCP